MCAFDLIIGIINLDIWSAQFNIKHNGFTFCSVQFYFCSNFCLMNFDQISMKIQWKSPLFKLCWQRREETNFVVRKFGERGEFFNRPQLGEEMINFQTKVIVDTNVERTHKSSLDLGVIITCRSKDAGGRRRGISWRWTRAWARTSPAPSPSPRTRAWTPALQSKIC